MEIKSRFPYILLALALILPQATGQYYNYYYRNYQYPNQIQQDSPYSTGASGYQNLQCARLWDSPDFRGRSLDFGSNDRRSDFRGVYFRPQAVKVKSGCSLTIFDNYGTKKDLTQDNNRMWDFSQHISAACCQCGGCDGEGARKGLQCARLYEHEKCNSCTGFRLDLKNGDKVKSFGHLDNLMSSLAIRPGCQLITYYQPNYQKYRFNFTQSNNLLGDNWYKQISSAECLCFDNPGPTPTWYTLPTVQTSAITLPTVLPTWYTFPPSTKWTERTTTTPKPTVKTTTPAEESWELTEKTEKTTLKTTTTQRTTTVRDSDSLERDVTTIKTTPRTTTTTESWRFSSEEETTTEGTTTSKPKTTTEDYSDYDPIRIIETTPPPANPTIDEEDDDDFGIDTTEDDDSDSDEDDDDWLAGGGDDDQEIETTTSTTPKTTTKMTTMGTTTTTTTTQEPEAEEEEEDDFFNEDW